ncbi:uncharacterized protein LOC118744650 [Rhagoletis pomonella]|uniref:uncharacterized protein LOC118744650 n=1 Tax=Rhagoletis pomonella TaxID=28610 RepID=UPI0017808653|nr:uncharacterized protein LOC118744650 [Rhagoletis pomonella]
MNSTFTANVPFQCDEVRHKWCNIKSYFSSEKQRMDKAKRSGAGGDENVQTSWKFYEALKFLQHMNEHTPSVNNFNKWSLQNLDPDPNPSRKLGEQLQPAECFDPGLLQVTAVSSRSKILKTSLQKTLIVMQHQLKSYRMRL